VLKKRLVPKSSHGPQNFYNFFPSIDTTKEHKSTIFHTAALRVLLAVHQAYKSTTCLRITQGNPNRLKKTFQMVQATLQRRRRRWSTDSSIPFAHITPMIHNDTLLLEIIHGKDFSYGRQPHKKSHPQ
jgi:hypothetical protein